MKEFILTEEEAKAVFEELRKAWITPDNQQVIWKLLQRIEQELEN